MVAATANVDSDIIKQGSYLSGGGQWQLSEYIVVVIEQQGQQVTSEQEDSDAFTKQINGR